MARIRRGEIRWADLGASRGHKDGTRRRVLVLSQDVFNDRSGTVIAVAITNLRPRAFFPLTLELGGGGLSDPTWVNISRLRTLASDRLGRRLGHASPEDLALVLEGLGEIIGSHH
jgi:mRNA interferase MazF